MRPISTESAQLGIDGQPSDRSRRRLRAGVGIGIGTGVVAAVAVAALGLGGSDEPTPVASNLPPATATVTKTTLTQIERVDGVLGYGEATAVTARPAPVPAGGGTLTWVASIGTVVERGGTLYKVDDHAVPLIYGTTPVYRTLTTKVSGADVKQLEENLSELGYTGFAVDNTFDTRTANAVKAWQKNLGLLQTGAIEIGQVVVAPDAVRVNEHRMIVGAQANGVVLTYTGTTRAVMIELDVARQHLLKADQPATVTLPDGRNIAGKVASVGTVATAGTQGALAQLPAATVIKVTVSIADQQALGTLDSAPVNVEIVATERKDVLTVPVAALVALVEGGYGVQVVDGTSTRYAPVETGLFAGGRVEIAGDGINEGVNIGIPK